MFRCTAAPIRSSLSAERPTDSGLAVGRSCATAMMCKTRNPSRTGTNFRFCPAERMERIFPPARLGLDRFRSRIPRDWHLTEKRLVRHVASDGCAVAEDRILGYRLPRLDRLEEHVQVRTHIVPVVAFVDGVLANRLFAQLRI